MTYNVDPDRWFDNEPAYPEHNRKHLEISPAACEKTGIALEDRCDVMSVNVCSWF